MNLQFAVPNQPDFGGVIPYGQTFETWRDSFARRIMKLDADTPDPGGFHVDVRARLLPRVFLTRYAAGPLSLIRTKGFVRDGSDGCSLLICAEGELEASFGDRDLTLHPGDAALLPHHQSGRITSRGDARSYALRFDREDARTYTACFEDLVLRRAAAGPATELIRLYCDQILSGDRSYSVPMASTMGSHLRELAAHLLNPRSDMVRSAPYGGVRAARLEAVQRFIVTNLREPWLSAETAGQHLSLSARYVQHLLEGERHRTMRITDIAYACGFTDLSYFNREFRRRFGETPTSARRKT
jgi:AraC-like DNA-binding protein